MTGVDIVEKALRRARERVEEAGVEMRLVHGDVTALREAGVGSGFRLLLDTGTFHGLSDAQREAMGREVSAVAAPDATLILDCFAPRRRGPLPRGAEPRRRRAAFPDWEITDVEVADTEPDPIARLFRFDERFYRLAATDTCKHGCAWSGTHRFAIPSKRLRVTSSTAATGIGSGRACPDRATARAGERPATRPASSRACSAERSSSG